MGIGDDIAVFRHDDACTCAIFRLALGLDGHDGGGVLLIDLGIGQRRSGSCLERKGHPGPRGRLPDVRRVSAVFLLLGPPVLPWVCGQITRPAQREGQVAPQHNSKQTQGKDQNGQPSDPRPLSPPLSGAQDGNPRCWDRDVGQVGHRLAGLFPGAALPETVMFVVHKLPPNRDVRMSGQRQGKGKLSDAVLAGRCDSLL